MKNFSLTGVALFFMVISIVALGCSQYLLHKKIDIVHDCTLVYTPGYLSDGNQQAMALMSSCKLTPVGTPIPPKGQHYLAPRITEV